MLAQQPCLYLTAKGEELVSENHDQSNDLGDGAHQSWEGFHQEGLQVEERMFRDWLQLYGLIHFFFFLLQAKAKPIEYIFPDSAFSGELLITS